MAQVFNKIYVDVRTKNDDIITAVQNDSNSRFLDVYLLDNGLPINLTWHEVRIYGKKADGKEIYNNGTITEATNGRCQFELTDQALAVAQDLEVQIVIYYNNVQILQSLPFTIHVVQSLISSGSIESSNEYGALVILFQNLYEAYDLMTDMTQNQGKKGAIATARSIDTFWQMLEYMAKYMDVDLTNMMQFAIEASKNAGAVMQNGLMFLPKLSWTPDVLETASQAGTALSYFVYNNIVYYADNTAKKVISFNAATLVKISETETQSGFSRSIFVANDILYYMDETSKKIISFNATTLQKLGETAVQSGYPRRIFVANNILYYLVSSPNKVITFDATTLQKISETEAQSGEGNDIFVWNDVLYYSDRTAKKVVALNIATLQKINETAEQIGIAYSIFVYNNILYYPDATAKKIISFNATTLEKLGETAVQASNFGMNMCLFVTNDVVYTTSNYHVIAFKGETLEKIYEYDPQQYVEKCFVVDDVVYCNPGNKIISLTEKFQLSHYERKMMS